MEIRTDRIAIALAVALATLAYFHFKPQPAPVGVHIPATPAKPVAKIEKTRIECAAPLSVYKPEAKGALKLPEPVAKDPAQHVAASTTTPDDERRHTVTTLVNTDTGDFTTYTRAEPHPWLAVKSKTELGIYGGYLNGEPAVRLAGRHELLQVKALHLGLVGSADATRDGLDTFVGVGAWARW